MIRHIMSIIENMDTGALTARIAKNYGTDILTEVARREAGELVAAEETDLLVEAVTRAAESVRWAMDGKKVILSRGVRVRIAEAVADGELPGDLAGRALRAGWPAPVARAVAAYGKAVRESVSRGRTVNKFWGEMATA